MMFAKVRKRDGIRGAKPLKSVDFSSHNVKTPALYLKAQVPIFLNRLFQ
jgi:hypothetical protein